MLYVVAIEFHYLYKWTVMIVQITNLVYAQMLSRERRTPPLPLKVPEYKASKQLHVHLHGY